MFNREEWLSRIGDDHVQFIKAPEDLRMDDAFCIEAVRRNGLVLQYIQDPSEIITTIAVRQNGLALEFVEEQNGSICISAIRNNPLAIEHVKPDYDICCFLLLKRIDLKKIPNMTPDLWGRLVVSKFIKEDQVPARFRTADFSRKIKLIS